MYFTPGKRIDFSVAAAGVRGTARRGRHPKSFTISDIPAQHRPFLYALDCGRLAMTESRDWRSPCDGAISWLDRADAIVRKFK
jgi:hypothetical protein